jgi:hypothetical protein
MSVHVRACLYVRRTLGEVLAGPRLRLLSRLESAEAWLIHRHVVRARPAHQRLLALSNVGHQLLHRGSGAMEVVLVEWSGLSTDGTLQLHTTDKGEPSLEELGGKKAFLNVHMRCFHCFV